MEPLTSMPNLPHFRANKPKLRGRGGDFKFTEGAAFFEQVQTGVVHRDRLPLRRT